MSRIRPATTADASPLLDLKLALDRETSFMMLEPGERPVDVEAERQSLAQLLSQPNSTLLVAESAAGQLAGYLEAAGGQFRRNQHVAQIIIGIRRSAAGQGIGTQLFEALEAWAGEAGIHRLELTVMAHNQAAIGLYHKVGFEIEGTRRASMRLDGAFIDEHYMARLLV